MQKIPQLALTKPFLSWSSLWSALTNGETAKHLLKGWRKFLISRVTSQINLSQIRGTIHANLCIIFHLLHHCFLRNWLKKLEANQPPVLSVHFGYIGFGLFYHVFISRINSKLNLTWQQILYHIEFALCHQIFNLYLLVLMGIDYCYRSVKVYQKSYKGPFTQTHLPYKTLGPCQRSLDLDAFLFYMSFFFRSWNKSWFDSLTRVV